MHLYPWLTISLFLHGVFLVSLPHWIVSPDPVQHSLPSGKSFPKMKLVRMEAPPDTPKAEHGFLPLEAASREPSEGMSSPAPTPAATPNKTAGVLSQLPALPLKNPPPRYPIEARRAGWEGSVRLCFQVDVSGQVSALEIDESSGHPLLDQAALSALKQWSFQPATHAGFPVTSIESQVFVFRIVPD